MQDVKYNKLFIYEGQVYFFFNANVQLFLIVCSYPFNSLVSRYYFQFLFKFSLLTQFTVSNLKKITASSIILVNLYRNKTEPMGILMVDYDHGHPTFIQFAGFHLTPDRT